MKDSRMMQLRNKINDAHLLIKAARTITRLNRLKFILWLAYKTLILILSLFTQ